MGRSKRFILLPEDKRFTMDTNNNKKAPASNKDKKKGLKGKRKPSTDVVVDITARRDFYKDQASKMTKLAVGSLVGVGLSLAGVFYSINKEADSVYFAVDENKALTELIALSQPNQKDAVVSNWLSRALVDTFDFNYSNMRNRLNESTMEWFTDSGRKELLNALVQSGHFKTIDTKKLIVSLAVDHVPLVVKKGNVSFTNAYLWKLEVPATITYRTESSVFSSNVLFTVTVSRRSLMQNAEGLGIARIVMETVNK